MKPRVFISSTYYDLKYVRESLEKFMYNMNFEPVLFEANKVTFEHGKPLDVSCFNEVKTCHIMILIIGGRYGSIISENESDVEKNLYDKEYISITRKEYETALQNNIPTFIFIDKNVYGEYGTYKINRDFYERAIEKQNFKFFHVDSINIFKFIDVVSAKAIKAFEKVDEIEDYLRDQISGMFHLYLESLKQNNRQDEIFDAVKELKNLTANINTVINEVGREIIKPEKYQEIIDQQYEVLLTYLFESFDTYLDVDKVEIELHTLDNETLLKAASYLSDNLLNEDTLRKMVYGYKEANIDTFIQNRISTINQINVGLTNIINGLELKQTVAKFARDYTKIKPLITTLEQESKMRERLKDAIKYADLPF